MSESARKTSLQKLENTRILYLDDVHDNLLNTERVFANAGITINTTDSIDEALGAAINKDLDIFICDLDLEEINYSRGGNTLLKEVREKNDSIFLALFSAFPDYLNDPQIKILKRKDVHVYFKPDDSVVLNLARDYSHHLEFYINKKIRVRDKYYKCLKTGTLQHLKSIDDNSVVLPVLDQGRYSVEDLIDHVTNDTVVGIEFTLSWSETLFEADKLD